MSEVAAKHVRPMIVILDDNEVVRESFKALMQSLYDEYDYHLFDRDDAAATFVTQNAANILGVIQDLNRSASDSPSSGIIFYRDVIERFLPQAKCLIASARIDESVVSSMQGGRVSFLHKSSALSEDIIRAFRWLGTPLTPPVENSPDPETASAVISIAPAWRQLCQYVVSNQNYLHTMSPSDFEMLAAELFRSHGWNVEFTSRTRDGGYDIIAVRNAQPSNLKVLIEAKRYSPTKPIGVGIVRSLYGIKQSKAASQLVLVTSTTVSLDAKKEFARVTPWELDFIERDKILQWCRENSQTKVAGF